MEVEKHEDTTKEEGELSDDEEIIPIAPQYPERTKVTDRNSPSSNVECRTLPNHRSYNGRSTSSVGRGVPRNFTPRVRSRRRARNRNRLNSDTKRVDNRLNEENIPSLLSLDPLVMQPIILLEPPPPPPPPPLPSIPPPDQPEPPPLHLPPETPRPKKRKVAGTRKNIPNSFCNKSPPAGDVEDPDYIDLLLEYQQIRKQLAKLAHAELPQTANKQTDGPSQVVDNQNEVYSQNSEDSKSEQQAINHGPKYKDKDTITNNPVDNDELDILRLRLDALKSVPSETTSKKVMGNQNTPNRERKELPKKLPFAPCSLRSLRSRRRSVKRRPVELLNRKSHPLDRRRSDERCGKQWKGEERRSYEKHRQREQYDMNQRRIEVQKILTLNDPEEQYRRFMELVAGVKEDQQIVGDGLARDNYEPVEMDLDSDGEQSTGINALPVNDDLFHPGLTYPLPNIDNPPPPVTYPSLMVPEGLTVPACLSDTDYRPLFDRNLVVFGQSSVDYVSDGLPGNAYPEYIKPSHNVKAYNQDIMPHQNLLSDGSNSVVQQVPDVNDCSEQPIGQYVIDEYVGTVSEQILEQYTESRRQHDPLDFAMSDSATDGSAKEEEAQDAESEEALLRAKLLQSLNAKKKLVQKVKTSSGPSLKSDVETLTDEKKVDAYDSSQHAQQDSPKCPSVAEHDSRQELVEELEQKCEQSESKQTQGMEQYHRKTVEENVTSLREQSKCNRTQQSIVKQDSNLPRSSSNSPVPRLTVTTSYTKLSQQLETDGSAVGSPYSNQDSLEAFTDPECSEIGLRWRADHNTSKPSRAKYYHHRSYYKVPQHEPVVICLAEDSESGDDEELPQPDGKMLPVSMESDMSRTVQTISSTDNLITPSVSLPGNLDTFLKEARMSVETKEKAVTSASVSSKLPKHDDGDELVKTTTNQCSDQPPADNNNGIENAMDKLSIIEVELNKNRCLLREKQTYLDKIKRQIARKKSVLCMAEEHVQKLREQLVSSEKIVKTNKVQLLKFNEQAQDAQSLVDEKRARVQALEAQLERLGKKAYGDTYKPTMTNVNNRNLKVTINKGSQESRQVILPQKKGITQNTSPTKRTVTVTNKATMVKSANIYSMKTSSIVADRSQPERKLVKKLQPCNPKEQNTETSLSVLRRTGADPSVPKNGGTVKGNFVLKKEQLAKTSTKVSEIAKEKARLMMLEKKYAEMIRKHKEAQAKKVLTSIPAKKMRLMPGKQLAVVSSASTSLAGRGQIVGSQHSHQNADNPTATKGKGKGFGENCQRKPNTVADVGKCPDKQTKNNTSKAIPQNVYGNILKEKNRITKNKRRTGNDEKIVALPTVGHSANGGSQSMLVSSPPYCNRFNNVGSIKTKPFQISTEIVTGDDYTSPDSKLGQSTSNGAYNSSLLQFHSYRLSPYFRLKSHHNLTSLTFSHNVNTDKVLCQYELMGTCSDDKCQYQHQSDYKLSNDELLKELASYYPQLYSRHPDGDLENDLDDFIAKFKKSSGKLTGEERCLLLVSQISEALKKVEEESVVTLQRCWRPSLDTRTQTDDLSNDTHLRSLSPNRHGSTMTSELTWSEPEVRYWSSYESDVHDGVVMNNDNDDTNNWISKAYYKLNNNKKREMGLNDALSILAKGLESNRGSSTLWLHYLELYEQKHNTTAIDKLYKQAIKYSPCFEIYWKYIQRTKPFSDSFSLCQNALDYLTSCDVKETLEGPFKQRSHHVLQVLVYTVMLCVSANRLGQASKVIKETLTSLNDESSKLIWFLTVEDRVLLHLLDGYMNVTGLFPYWIYSPQGTPKHWLVNKDLLLTSIPWFEILADSRPEVQENKIKLALASVSQALQIIVRPGDQTLPVSIKLTLLYLHKNWTEINLRNFSDVNELLAKLRHANYKSLIDITLWYSVIIETLSRAHQLDHYCLTIEDINMLQEEALKLPCCPARLYLALADWRFAVGDNDTALVLMEDCVISMFDCDDAKPNECDPNNLYSKVLGLPLPLSYTGLPLKIQPTRDWIQEQLPYLWQCYCFLLELQGFDKETPEAYEAAILSIRDSTFLTQLWLRYVHQQIRLVHHLEKSGQADAHAQYTSLVFRCLNSLPSRVELPYWSGQTWSDYEPHNAVISVYLSTCPMGEEHLLNVYERLVKTLPQDVPLLVRAVDYMRSIGHHSLAIGYCMTGLDSMPHSRELWMIYINLLKERTKCEKDREQISAAYRRATFYLQMEAFLWRDWAVFEFRRKNVKRLQQVFDQCTLAACELESLSGVQRPKVSNPEQDS